MPATGAQGNPNTWDGVVASAKAAGCKYPEVVAAQWALESGWGKHTSGNCNFFGLKGGGSKKTTTEVINGKTITIQATFLNFPSLDACVEYLVSRWYKDWKTYKGINNAQNAVAATEELVKQGYATDPEYARKLQAILDQKIEPEADQGHGLKNFRIEAVVRTHLKKYPRESTKLAENEKKLVEPGKDYAVTAFEELAADAHAKVELAYGAGEWFIYQPHWKRIQAPPQAVEADIDWSDFNSMVTANLSVGEVLQWDKRRIPGPNASVRNRLKQTAAQYQQVREAWGGPLVVSSFYRPEPINSQVGGVPSSRHVIGEAFDIYPRGRGLEEFYQWIRVRWTGGLGDGRNRGFIHLDTRNGGHFVPGAGARPSVEWDY